MKFIELKSRGGNYLVVAENVAWLRDYENGQTQVGMVGGAPLLVAGTVEEIAGWGQAGEAQRLAIWERIESRQLPRSIT